MLDQGLDVHERLEAAGACRRVSDNVVGSPARLGDSPGVNLRQGQGEHLVLVRQPRFSGAGRNTGEVRVTCGKDKGGLFTGIFPKPPHQLGVQHLFGQPVRWVEHPRLRPSVGIREPMHLLGEGYVVEEFGLGGVCGAEINQFYHLTASTASSIVAGSLVLRCSIAVASSAGVVKTSSLAMASGTP